VNVTNTRITNINVTNINVTNITYVNRNAVVAMPQNSFASAQPVQRAGVRVDANQMRQAQVIGAAPRVAPQRESVLAASSGRRANAPPAAIANRPVAAKLVPPPRAVSFAAKQQMLQQHPGAPVAPAELQTLRSQAARQNPAPGRMQVQTINTTEVHPVTPTIHRGPAPTFAQRPVQPQTNPGEPAIRNPVTQPAPASRPLGTPPVQAQPQPQMRQPPPAVRAQPQPPVYQAPATGGQPQPQVRQPPPAVRAQPQPPVYQAPATGGQPQPQVRQPPPAVRTQPQPAVRQQPQPARPQAQPQPPARKPPPPQKEEKKPEDKKPEEK
jgi:hypothetical protein